MFCEKCGAKLDDGVKFCHKCGTPVPRPTVQPLCCVKCGAPLVPGNSFCTKCDTPVPGRAPAAAPVNPGKPPKAPKAPKPPKPPKPPKQKKQKAPGAVSGPGAPVPGDPSPTVVLTDTPVPETSAPDAPAPGVPKPPASGGKGRKTAAIVAIVLAGILLIGAGIGAALRFGPGLLSRASEKGSRAETAEATPTPAPTDASDETAAPEATPAPTPVPEEEPAPAAAWQDRYRSLIQAGYAGTVAEYALFDMDANGTPELILRLDYTHFLFYTPDADAPVYDYPGTERTSVEVDQAGTGLCLMESGEGGSLIVYELTLADGTVTRDTSYTGPWSADLFGDTYLTWHDVGDLSALDAYAP